MSDIKTVGVVGAGQMGRGIAQVAAQAGLDVIVLDATLQLAQDGVAQIRGALDKLVGKGKLAADARDDAMKRIAPAGSYDALAGCDIAIEAAPEDTALKQEIFRKLDQATRPGCLLASNTSSISITKIASATGRPDKVIGLHFFNPVPVMKLVEVIRGLETADETYRVARALAERMGKTAIAARDTPGFIVNRLLIPLLNEACFALYEGLGSAEDIDTGCRLGLGHPIGPLALCDLIGLDTCLAVAEVLHAQLGEDKYRPSPLLRQYVDAGWLGRKTGRGFYVYDEGGRPAGTGAARGTKS